MAKRYQLALHIFRRDLRLQDNAGLIEALQSAEQVIPCFIFDDRQLGEKNSYKAEACLKFMANSLNELNAALQQKQSQLYCFKGIAEQVLEKLLKILPIEAVFFNRDYTPFSRQRDSKIQEICRNHQIDFHCHADALLNEPEACLKANGEPYTVFTPFMRRASLLNITQPQDNRYKHYYQKPIAGCDQTTLKQLLKIDIASLAVQGGRAEGLALLKKIATLKDYQEQRNFPALNKTTHLSAHHKFGTISIRETYQTIIDHFNKHHTLVNELYWRDFFTHIIWHFPQVLGSAFHQQYNKLKWSKNENHFQAWCQGNTGFPIVDAGMRELNQTGYMHNRVRMITASFLTKDLHIDWQRGEEYFAQKLVDYDPAVNNGNWQWAASTGCDAQPYFRIFNPWLQQKKFDSDCIYIKKWVPELNHLSPKEIHQLNVAKPLFLQDYPHPIIDHSVESLKTKSLYAAQSLISKNI